jgi:hypothetical protein
MILTYRLTYRLTLSLILRTPIYSYVLSYFTDAIKIIWVAQRLKIYWAKKTRSALLTGFITELKTTFRLANNRNARTVGPTPVYYM